MPMARCRHYRGRGDYLFTLIYGLSTTGRTIRTFTKTKAQRKIDRRLFIPTGLFLRRATRAQYRRVLNIGVSWLLGSPPTRHLALGAFALDVYKIVWRRGSSFFHGDCLVGQHSDRNLMQLGLSTLESSVAAARRARACATTILGLASSLFHISSKFRSFPAFLLVNFGHDVPKLSPDAFASRHYKTPTNEVGPCNPGPPSWSSRAIHHFLQHFGASKHTTAARGAGYMTLPPVMQLGASNEHCPGYDTKSDPAPPYTRLDERPETLARYLFRYGFAIGDKSATEQAEELAIMRATELMWARRSLYAIIVFSVVAGSLVYALFLMGSGAFSLD
ncbi:hypothetical protein BS47DRAFT_1385895 [Hydnum rufescens UP504]|uniref:Uncharacterized protein n=1 Tax=Hydnum rufescens UP504 TaxID=1448309 RepID=A0A9P6AHH4_9AGAM|nr:hypothetical protein BS47DRAFT_1385895 [Hydnum rufescens UP504]